MHFDSPNKFNLLSWLLIYLCNKYSALHQTFKFQSILSDISALCIINNVEPMCVLGDMNTDFSRAHSWHTQALNRFIDHENCMSLYSIVAQMCLIVIVIVIVKVIQYLIIFSYQRVFLII